MPNWCSTTFKFFSDNSEQLTEFYNRIIELTSRKSKTPNDFGVDWLGNIVEGMLEKEESDNIYYRGWVDDAYDKTENSFSVQTETAWVPMTQMWNVILEKHYPEIHYVFIAEEIGCELYVKSDTENLYFPEWYKIDCCISGTDNTFEDYCETPEQVVQVINDVFNLNLSTLEQAKQITNEYNRKNESDGNYCYIHEFEETTNFDWE